MAIRQRLVEIIRACCADALSSAVNLYVDRDVMLAVLAQALLAALRTRLPGYATVTPTPSSAVSSRPRPDRHHRRGDHRPPPAARRRARPAPSRPAWRHHHPLVG
jgi:hypothetical protein